MLTSWRGPGRGRAQYGAAPYCACGAGAGAGCRCGETDDHHEWRWEESQDGRGSVLLNENRSQVTFHPSYSSGTAVVRGDAPMKLNHQYYWEVKILSDVYGTDIMVGVGTRKVNMTNALLKFCSVLGEDSESYGLSYTGRLHHKGLVLPDSVGFCKGSLVGARVDMWHGTLEYFINRKPQGVSFYNLRRHGELFPMICSTAAQSSMRLTCAVSHRASLLVDAAKTLAFSQRRASKGDVELPPGFHNMLRGRMWLMMPRERSIFDEEEPNSEADIKKKPTPPLPNSSNKKRKHWETITRRLDFED